MTPRNSRFLIATGAAALLVVAAAASAQSARGDRPSLPLGTAEMQQKIGERSAAIDANRDGFITVEEVRAHREAERERRARERFARLDTNGDGRVSVAEFEAKQLERIERLDANNDGQIDRAEFRHGRKHSRMHRRGGGE